MAAQASTRLVRGRFNARIHKATCRHAVNVVPWVWAEGRADEEWVVMAWLKPCRVCLPDLARLQDRLRAEHNAKEA